jgi:hypothetical protein
MDESNGTYLEDFLSSIEFVPNDIRGNFELIRELDKEVTGLQQELRAMQASYIYNLKESSAGRTATGSGSNGEMDLENSKLNGNANSISNSISSSEHKSSISDSNNSNSECSIDGSTNHEVESANKNVRNTNNTAISPAPTLAAIKALSDRIHQRLTYKIVISQKMSDDVDNITRKLESDLAFFETDLRGCGEFEVRL